MNLRCRVVLCVDTAVSKDHITSIFMVAITSTLRINFSETAVTSTLNMKAVSTSKTLYQFIRLHGVTTQKKSTSLPPWKPEISHKTFMFTFNLTPCSQNPNLHHRDHKTPPTFWSHRPIYVWVVRVISFLRALPPNPCQVFPPLTCMPHGSPTFFYLILSAQRYFGMTTNN